MADPIAAIDLLIRQTRQWRIGHRDGGRRIEAAACAVRERALEDAKSATAEAVQKEREACAGFAEKAVGRLSGIGIANAIRLGQHYE